MHRLRCPPHPYTHTQPPTTHSPSLPPGQATLESLPPGTQPRFPPMALGGAPARVHGVLYRIRRGDLKKMQQREQGYALTHMEVGCRVAGARGVERACPHRRAAVHEDMGLCTVSRIVP